MGEGGGESDDWSEGFGESGGVLIGGGEEGGGVPPRLPDNEDGNAEEGKAEETTISSLES